MKYLYYPGCSLKSSGRAYEESLLPVLAALGVEVEEIADWNCCGATTYMSIDERKAFGLAARNLALAEAQAGEDAEQVQVIAPCSACYLGLAKAQAYMRKRPGLQSRVLSGLEQVGLKYEDKVRVRHPVDVLLNDVGAAAIARLCKNPLKGLKVASYYGCQMLRPFATFDDAHNPTSMDQLAKAAGATPVDWPLKTRCCGGSLTGTITEVGVRLSQILLREAVRRGADVVTTNCPLCQLNLECFQKQMNRMFGEKIQIPVMYFSQLLGVALGIPQKDLGFDRLFVPFRYSPPPPPPPKQKEVAHA